MSNVHTPKNNMHDHTVSPRGELLVTAETGGGALPALAAMTAALTILAVHHRNWLQDGAETSSPASFWALHVLCKNHCLADALAEGCVGSVGMDAPLLCHSMNLHAAFDVQ